MTDLRQAAERILAPWDNQYWDSNASHRPEDDAMLLARAYLAEHPADDDTPVDEDWLLLVGFSISIVGKTDVSLHMRRVWQAEMSDVSLAIDGDGDAELNGSVIPKKITTRGDVRRLCNALGTQTREGTPE